MKDTCQPEFDGQMTMTLPVDISFVGGSVLVEVAGGMSGVKLTRLVTDVIESKEGRFGMIADADLAYLSDMHHELALAAKLVASRIASERARAALREGG